MDAPPCATATNVNHLNTLPLISKHPSPEVCPRQSLTELQLCRECWDFGLVVAGVFLAGGWWGVLAALRLLTVVVFRSAEATYKRSDLQSSCCFSTFQVCPRLSHSQFAQSNLLSHSYKPGLIMMSHFKTILNESYTNMNWLPSPVLRRI